MTDDVRNLFERALRGFDPDERPDPVLRRGRRIVLGRRILSGALALIIAATGTAFAARQFSHRSGLGALLSSRDGFLVFASTEGQAESSTAPPGQSEPVYGARDLYALLPDGTGLVRLTDTPQDESGPAVSPDRTRIAFNRDGHVWLMNLDGSSLRKLTDWPADPGSPPAWSPDGTQIAFAALRWCSIGPPPSSPPDHCLGGDEGEGREVVVAGVGGEPLWSSSECGGKCTASQPDWSASGSIVFVAGSPFSGGDKGGDVSDRLMVVPMAHGSRVGLTFEDGAFREPDWSPDASQVAADAEGHIVRVDAGTGAVHENAPAAGNESSPAWSPDGTRIASIATRVGSADIRVASADGFNPRVVHTALGRVTDLDWVGPNRVVPRPTLSSGGNGSLSVEPASAKVGEEVVIRGSGCRPYPEASKVHLSADADQGGTSGRLDVGDVDPDSFEVHYRIPESSLPTTFADGGPLRPGDRITFRTSPENFCEAAPFVVGGSVTGPFQPSAIRFFDERHGLAAGHLGRLDCQPICAGAIQETTDGGRSWTTLYRGDGDLVQLATYGSSDVWSLVQRCNSNSENCRYELLHSRDGARSWESLGAPGVSQLSYMSTTVGWARDRKGYARTIDGGRTWTDHPAPCKEGWMFSGVSFVSATRGWFLCGSEPGGTAQGKELHATTDGGASWPIVSSSHVPGDPSGGGAVGDLSVGGQIAGLWFGPAEGLLGGSRGPTQYSTDGGVTWHATDVTEVDGSWLTDASFVGSVVFALVFDSGGKQELALKRSDDHGATWQKVFAWPFSY